MKILSKPEIYSYDEINGLIKILEKSENSIKLSEILKKFYIFSDSIKENQASMALFFMPESTYKIFSIFQGENALCNLSKEELKAVYDAVSENSKINPENKFSAHILQKLKVLLNFLEAGNNVKPVTTSADSFSELQA